jgi:hypothetical protein
MPFTVQVLDQDLRVVFADLGRELVQEISAYIGYAPMTTRQAQSGFLAMVRTSLLAGMGAGEAAQLVQALPQRLRSLYLPPVG